MEHSHVDDEMEASGMDGSQSELRRLAWDEWCGLASAMKWPVPAAPDDDVRGNDGEQDGHGPADGGDTVPNDGTGGNVELHRTMTRSSSAATKFDGVCIEAVARGTLSCLLQRAFSIPRLTTRGAQQLATDLDYFRNVLDALGVLPDPVLDQVMYSDWYRGPKRLWPQHLCCVVAVPVFTCKLGAASGVLVGLDVACVLRLS